MTFKGFTGLFVSVLEEPCYEAAFSLRYQSYLQEDAISPSESGLFIDRYDFLRTSVLIGVREAGRGLVGVIRFAVQPPCSTGIADYISGPEFVIFPDELTNLLQDDRPIASGARFAIEAENPRRQQIALLLVRAQLIGARAVGAKWGIATAKGGHLAFYRRLLTMNPIGEARQMPGLAYAYQLLAGDVEAYFAAGDKRFPQDCIAHFDETAPEFEHQIRNAMPALLNRWAA
jgi:hypothetical protein